MESIKYIYLYDRNEVLLERYPSWISQILHRELKEKIAFVFIYSEQLRKGDKPQNLPDNSVVIFQPFLNLRFLEKLIAQYRPVAYMSIGLRIPDILLLAYFNGLNVPTYMVQHGIFVKQLSRVGFVQHFANNFNQFKKYFIYSLSISKMIGMPFHRCLKEFYAFYIKGTKKFNEMNMPKDANLLSREVFCFDSSWDTYYIENYGYLKHQLIYFGNPDYTLAKECLANPLEDAICYISQSLVEDGRYLNKDLQSFLYEMKKNLKGEKVYIKLHPRSNVEIYKHLEDENFLMTTSFKNCTTYLGHYSSLLEVSSQLGRNVVLWQLEGHDIPESYVKYGDLITSDWEEVKFFLEVNRTFDFKMKNKLKKFLNMTLEPFEVIAKKVINDLKS
jgi:hypothetical protein